MLLFCCFMCKYLSKLPQVVEVCSKQSVAIMILSFAVLKKRLNEINCILKLWKRNVGVMLKCMCRNMCENKDFCFALFHFGFSLAIPNFFINFASGFV